MIHEATGVSRNRILCLAQATSSVDTKTKDWKNHRHTGNPTELCVEPPALTYYRPLQPRLQPLLISTRRLWPDPTFENMASADIGATWVSLVMKAPLRPRRRAMITTILVSTGHTAQAFTSRPVTVSLCSENAQVWNISHAQRGGEKGVEATCPWPP